MTKKIIWEKWNDPFNVKADVDEEDDFDVAEFSIDNNENKTAFIDMARQLDVKMSVDTLKNFGGDVIITPMGIIPITESNKPSAIFNFWVAHANFDLTRPIVNKLKKMPGVEALCVFTRYRFRIAIAKAFNPEQVKQWINDKFCVEEDERPKNKELPPGVVALAKTLEQKYPYWVIFIMKTNKLEYFGSALRAEVEQKMNEKLEQTKDVVKSW